jgi:hypothetical protein
MNEILKFVIGVLIAFISSLIVVKYNFKPLDAWLIGGISMALINFVSDLLGD